MMSLSTTVRFFPFLHAPHQRRPAVDDTSDCQVVVPRAATKLFLVVCQSDEPKSWPGG